MKQQATFQPHMETLTPAQKDLWPLLSQLPPSFIMYNDTACSLRYGHEPAPSSFEFKSARPFLPHDLVAQVPFLQGAKFEPSGPSFLQAQIETLHGPVDLKFEGDCQLKEMRAPERTPGNGVAVASALDLGAVKMMELPKRNHVRDYQDVAAFVRDGISVAEMTSAATAITKGKFDEKDAADAAKAVTEFSGHKATAIPESTKELLSISGLQAEARPYLEGPHSKNLSLGLGIEKTPEADLTNQRPSLKLDLNRELERDNDRGA